MDPVLKPLATESNQRMTVSPNLDPRSRSDEQLQSLLRVCVEAKGSDLHLSVGEPPFIRRGGLLFRLADQPPLSHAEIQGLAGRLTRDIGSADLDRRGAVDGAVNGRAGGRFRFNVFRRQNQLSIAIRRLEDTIRTLDSLGLPTSLYDLADLADGLVIVAGPTGSGKTTTLATLIDHIAQNHAYHIITIEDPVEYLHRSQRSLVQQRQLGLDCPSFYEALIASLRQDPDVILVGEIRDLNTIRTAITAAETGHLVFTTVHAGDSVGAMERITSVFPAEEQSGVRRQLAMVLRTVISQQLMVADGSAVAADIRKGENRVARRVMCSEIMHVNTAIANLISVGKTNQIYSTIETGGGTGMQTRDQDLARLLQAGLISARKAMNYAHHPAVVRERLRRLRDGSFRTTGGASRRMGGVS